MVCDQSRVAKALQTDSLSCLILHGQPGVHPHTVLQYNTTGDHGQAKSYMQLVCLEPDSAVPQAFGLE